MSGEVSISVSREHKLWPEFRDLIVSMMRMEGRDFTTCELCHKPIPDGKFDIHHTKYEGATYYDLLIVHRKCNLAPEQRYLK